jgi:hypothetical protein
MNPDEKLFREAIDKAGIHLPGEVGTNDFIAVLNEMKNEFIRQWRDGFIVGYQVAKNGKAYEPHDD